MDAVRLRDDDLSWREVDQQVVVLDLRASVFLELNRSGTVLWKRLAEGPATHDELRQALVEAFGIDDERAGGDVNAFVASLIDLKLLQG